MSVKYLAAYCLAILGGKAQPTEGDVKKILNEVGVSVNDDDLKNVVNTLKGKKINEVIADGQKKLANVSFGGSASGGAAPAKTEAKAEVKEPAKKEEKKKEPEPKKEEEDFGLGGDLFGDFQRC